MSFCAPPERARESFVSRTKLYRSRECSGSDAQQVARLTSCRCRAVHTSVRLGSRLTESLGICERPAPEQPPPQRGPLNRSCFAPNFSASMAEPLRSAQVGMANRRWLITPSTKPQQFCTAVDSFTYALFAGSAGIYVRLIGRNVYTA
jgi:hypothetical protein